MSSKIFKTSYFTSVLVLVSTIAIIMGILFGFFEKQIENELASEAMYLSQAVENEGIKYFSGLERTDKRISVVNESGVVVYDSQTDISKLDNHADREEIKAAMRHGVGISRRYSKTLTEKTVYYAKKLSDNSVLRVSTNQYTVVTILMGLGQPIAILFIGALIICFVLSQKVSRSIIKPINSLDLDNPENNTAYEELQPLLNKLSKQKKAINQQLLTAKKNEEFRREFTANVSHELKTPLTSISGFAELMKSGDTPTETVVDFSKSIYDEAQRLISLVSDIIKISELDEDKISPKTDEVDLYALSSEIIQRLKPYAQKRNVTFSLIGASAIIHGTRKIIYEMIYNLCDNAIKYNKDNGFVDVVVTQTTNTAVVKVSDTGIGIPKEYHDRVFERFYRVDKSHSKSVGGTGLGLAIVKHGAMFHNAKVSLSSTEGKGTSVSLEFQK